MVALDIHYLIGSQVSRGGASDESCVVSLGDPAKVIVQAVVGKFRDQLTEVMRRIVEYLATYRKLQFEEFVCDFIRDAADNLWFIQVKAFVVCSGVSSITWGTGVWAGEEREAADRGRCGVCECTFRRCDLQNVLNSRQIHGMHERLQHWSRGLSWSPHQTSLLGRDQTTYERLSVCSDCHDLYTALDKLTAVCSQFGGHLGATVAQDVLCVDIDSSEYPLHLDNGHSTAWKRTLHAAQMLSTARSNPPPSLRTRSASLPQFGHKAQAQLTAMRSQPPQMPSDWQCRLKRNGTQTVVSVKKEPRFLRFRLLVLIQASGHELEKLQLASMEQGHLALSWSVLGVERCVAIPHNVLERSEAKPILTSFGAQHMYVHSVGDLVQWVEASPTLTMNVVALGTGNVLGYISLDLRHVVTNRIELHNFEAPLRGLQSGAVHFAATLGFTGGTAFDCERLDLEPRLSGIAYVPRPGIVIPESLPASWLSLLTRNTELMVDPCEPADNPKRRPAFV